MFAKLQDKIKNNGPVSIAQNVVSILYELDCLSLLFITMDAGGTRKAANIVV